MNRYFYVPVTSELVKHDGISLLDHLKMVDKELYYRSMAEASFEKLDTPQYEHLVTTKNMFKAKVLPERVIIVDSDNYGRYELVSMEFVEVSSMEELESYEVTGYDVVDIFDDYPSYTDCALNFFDVYSSKKEEKEAYEEKHENEIKQKKIGQRILTSIFRRKTDK